MTYDTRLIFELFLNSAWADVTYDVLTGEGIHYEYGTPGKDVLDRSGAPGAMTFNLNNSARNSGTKQGYYSYGHANCRLGFKKGVDARLRLQYGTDKYDSKLYGDGMYGGEQFKFQGKLLDAVPEPGMYDTQRTLCRVGDWFNEADEVQVDLLPIQSAVRSDVYLGRVVDSMLVQPGSRRFDVGQETFAYVGDALKDEKTTILAVLQKIALSEFGYVFRRAEGSSDVLRFQSRQSRGSDTVVLTTLAASDVIAAESNYGDFLIYNDVTISVYPRVMGTSPETLYTLGNPLALDPGVTQTFTASYTDPTALGTRISGTNMIKPIVSTDYEFSSSSAGGGDLNANLSVALTYGGNAAEVTLKNNGGGAGYVTKFRLRGTAIRTYEAVEINKTDSSSITLNGTRTLQTQLHYQTSQLVANDLAGVLLARYKDPVVRLNAVTFATKNDNTYDALAVREPGDRVKVSESVTGITDKEYFIQWVSTDLYPGVLPNTWQGTTTWTILETSSEAYWKVGTAGSTEIGQTTVLGF